MEFLVPPIDPELRCTAFNHTAPLADDMSPYLLFVWQPARTVHSEVIPERPSTSFTTHTAAGTRPRYQDQPAAITFHCNIPESDCAGPPRIPTNVDLHGAFAHS